jgi:hypothetical protein
MMMVKSSAFRGLRLSSSSRENETGVEFTVLSPLVNSVVVMMHESNTDERRSLEILLFCLINLTRHIFIVDNTVMDVVRTVRL